MIWPSVKDFLRNGKLVTLMIGHLTVDSYVGVIPVLYPVLIGRFQLSLATVGLVSLAYGGTAAISQPLFGVIADRFGTRLTGVALAWTALTFALTPRSTENTRQLITIPGHSPIRIVARISLTFGYSSPIPIPELLRFLHEEIYGVTAKRPEIIIHLVFEILAGVPFQALHRTEDYIPSRSQSN